MKGKIFNAQEVQSILSGSKVMFREIAKIKLSIASYNFDTKQFYDDPIFKKCPYQVGQKIFVKESFVDFRSNNSDIFYKSDFEVNNLVKTADLKWKTAQHMKQEHSRLTLLIKEIRLEKLIPITQEDCVAEGVKFGYEETNWGATKAFKDNWNATHKKPEEKFEVNPFVWVVDFKINK